MSQCSPLGSVTGEGIVCLGAIGGTRFLKWEGFGPVETGLVYPGSQYDHTLPSCPTRCRRSVNADLFRTADLALSLEGLPLNQPLSSLPVASRYRFSAVDVAFNNKLVGLHAALHLGDLVSAYRGPYARACVRRRNRTTIRFIGRTSRMSISMTFGLYLLHALVAVLWLSCRCLVTVSWPSCV